LCLAHVWQVGGPAVVDDTSLCFTALNGMPGEGLPSPLLLHDPPEGPYIKHFLDAIGHIGLNNLLAAYPDKSAHAQAIIAFSLGPSHEPVVFVGRTPGKVAALIPPHTVFISTDRGSTWPA
jgi:inosine triphosphate pyrophosphatase